MSIHRINRMLCYFIFPQEEKQKYYFKRKGLRYTLFAGLLMKVNPYEDLICIKRKILNITFKEMENIPIRRAESLFCYKVLDLKRVNFRKHYLGILNKVIGNYLINLSLRI